MADDKQLSKLTAEQLMLRQSALQKLYEGRIASLERFVGFVVLFHEMAKQVQARGCGRRPPTRPGLPNRAAAHATSPLCGGMHPPP